MLFDCDFFFKRDFFLSALRLRAHPAKRSANAMLEDNLVKHNGSPMERKTKVNMTTEKHNHRVVFFNGHLAVQQKVQ